MMGRPHVLIVEARFYEDIAEALMEGAEAVLNAAGATIERHAVPGAFEVPAAVRMAVDASQRGTVSRPFDGYIALGCVIRGETDHYEHICRETCRALMSLSVRHQLALGFGILTCPTYEQARHRAAVDGLNKGADAARACLRMIELKRALGPLA